jgi:hypothetical protein
MVWRNEGFPSSRAAGRRLTRWRPSRTMRRHVVSRRIRPSSLKCGVGKRHHQVPPSDTYFELCLSVNTFCALVWTLFWDNCNYYKGLFDVCKTLDLQEVHIIRESFTANVCRRITWAILSDGRLSFNTALVDLQFCRGEQVQWPTSLIYKITDNVRFAKSINRPFYPTKWLVPAVTGGQGTGGSGRNSGGYGMGANQGGPKDMGRDPKQRGRDEDGGGRGRRQPWVDNRHPKIVAMMADYVASRGLQVQLTEILDASNKRITNLPTIPDYIKNGWPFVCWAHMLGRCSFPNCPFREGHVPRDNIPDKFADKVVAMLLPGVRHCSRPRDSDESPRKRKKGNNQQ